VLLHWWAALSYPAFESGETHELKATVFVPSTWLAKPPLGEIVLLSCAVSLWHLLQLNPYVPACVSCLGLSELLGWQL
jgi:hypothetical protein